MKISYLVVCFAMATLFVTPIKPTSGSISVQAPKGVSLFLGPTQSNVIHKSSSAYPSTKYVQLMPDPKDKTKYTFTDNANLIYPSLDDHNTYLIANVFKSIDINKKQLSYYVVSIPTKGKTSFTVSFIGTPGLLGGTLTIK